MLTRGQLNPSPQSGFAGGFTIVQQRALASVTIDQTTPGALVACMGAPRTAIVITPYSPTPWFPAAGM